MMNKKIIIAIIAIVILAIFAYGIYYVNDYYHADKDVENYLSGTDDVKVIQTSNGLLLDGPSNDTALIFYPGAKVEYTSYLPLFTELAHDNVDCFIVEMPFNLALLNENAAEDIMSDYNYTNYYISGHSLGGVVASNYVNHTNQTEGLILFSAYPTEKIEKPVLSIYGSEDKVLNIEKYNDSKSLMDNLTEIIIQGGNHAPFANYGPQQCDGMAKITPEKQQDEIRNAIIEFID